jgi:hypothetical protein
MKLLLAIFVVAAALPLFAQNAGKPAVPKYNRAAEAVYQGTVIEVRDRQCPVSGGMGSHIIMKLDGNPIEVHLATTAFTKMMEMNLQTGDSIQVTGWKTEFEGVQTIFAREVKYGNDTYVFRTKDGAPAWIF